MSDLQNRLDIRQIRIKGQARGLPNAPLEADCCVLKHVSIVLLEEVIIAERAFVDPSQYRRLVFTGYTVATRFI